MSPLMIMSWYSPGKDTLTQAHIVSLDPCRIRSCLEQSWLRLGTQPELLQHVSGERERANRPNWWKKHTAPPPYKHTQFKAFAWCTHFALAFPACQWRCTEKSAFTTSGNYTHYCQLFQQLGYILWLGKHLEVLLLFLTCRIRFALFSSEWTDNLTWSGFTSQNIKKRFAFTGDELLSLPGSFLCVSEEQTNQTQ